MNFALILTLTGALAIDGDTLKLDGTSYRLFGIDAYERSHPLGPAATQALRALIRGKTLTCNIKDVDRYRRPVVRCDLPDGRDLSCAMVATGLARDWPKYSGGFYARCGE